MSRSNVENPSVNPNASSNLDEAMGDLYAVLDREFQAGAQTPNAQPEVPFYNAARAQNQQGDPNFFSHRVNDSQPD